MIVVNTHLTFPHNEFDERILRLRQITETVTGIDRYIEDNGITRGTVIICGDFNSTIQYDKPEGIDVVYDYMIRQGYTSSYRSIHGREPGASHFNHNAVEASVDFIFYRILDKSTQFETIDSYLVPKAISDETWPHGEYLISDHRPLQSQFKTSF
eukprot:TRINITY_DN8455_c0_g1_i1.p1 TRINITY_DN8455_c0_g1~~TRINITY_DN8455_c0_g1_i1.p1  ORF type:complete len:155 (+),score=13.39 TRINITY_DN8455_c0_g1_i1:464-928(+)